MLFRSGGPIYIYMEIRRIYHHSCGTSATGDSRVHKQTAVLYQSVYRRPPCPQQASTANFIAGMPVNMTILAREEGEI